MNLIPITKIYLEKEQWLSQKIKYEQNLILKTILIDISKDVYSWIYNKNDIIEIVDYDSFTDSFINFCYQSYTNNIDKYTIDYDENYEFYELKYLEEVNEIFLKIKNYLDLLGIILFNQNHFMDLFYFIYQNINVMDDDQISDNEFNDEEINSMLIVTE